MKSKITLITLAVTMTLTACGGGGGASTTASNNGTNSGSGTPPVTTPPVTTPPVTTPPVTTPGNNGNLQTSVPAPTYAASTPELFTFNEINTFRKALGLGLISQNAALDKAAINHANYIALNQVTGHNESSLLNGYTGDTPAARQAFAGFTAQSSGGEIIGFAPMPDAIYSLINSVYHRDVMATQFTANMGISYNTGWGAPLVVEFGSITPQNNASSFTTNYPIDGQTGLPLTTRAESPSPLPSTVVTVNDFATKTSSPVTFYSAYGTTLVVNSFTVTKSGSSTPLAATLITSSSDTNKLVGTNTAHLIGNAPFLPNTKYVVNFTGSVNGVSVTKTWSFTTGTSLDVGSGL